MEQTVEETAAASEQQNALLRSQYVIMWIICPRMPQAEHRRRSNFELIFNSVLL
jgi:hypothetical protein